MNPDVTTYPADQTPEAQAEHQKYLGLEREGKVWRYVDNDGTTHAGGKPFIIWRPTEGAPVAPPTDESEVEPH